MNNGDKIKLIIDRKVVTWIRMDVEVDAVSVQEAIKKYKQTMFQDCVFLRSRELSELRVPVTVKENNHTATIEIYSPGYPDELWNNKNGYNAPFFERDKKPENAPIDAPRRRHRRAIT